MDYLTLIFCGGLGIGVSAILICLILKSSAHWAQQRGGQFHQTHGGPIPRFGGIALAGAFLVSALVGMLFLSGEPLWNTDNLVVVASALAMFAVGLYDDFKPLGAKRKLLFQLLIASAVYTGGIRIELLKNPITGTVYELGMLSFWVTILWLVAITNLINLIDGIDGLAGGISLMLMVLLASFAATKAPFGALLAMGVAGALMAFLYYNFPPARIYMGDGGAYFLGFLIGLLTIQTSHKGTVAAALVAPLFALALPILDTSTAIVRRGLLGLPIFRADRGHIHHRLSRMGFSRRRTVLLLYAFSLVFLACAFGVFWMEGRFLPIWVGVAAVAVIVPAHKWGFIPHPKQMGTLMRDSSELRHESTYALALGRWFELEADRTATIDGLWATYQFVAKKLGFVRVKLVLENRAEVWQLDEGVNGHELHEKRFGNLGGEPVTIELAAPTSMSTKTFDHLSELAAEMWLNAACRWRKARQLPIRWGTPSAAATGADMEVRVPARSGVRPT